MTIEILALYELDGSAIIKHKERLFFLTPPYSKKNLCVVSEDLLGKAILYYGFSEVKTGFKSWELLIKFLNSKVIESRKKIGQDISEINLDHEIIDLAPEYVLNNYLDRVEKELLPSYSFEHAESVIIAILESENARKYGTILNRAIVLLNKLKNDTRQKSLGSKKMLDNILFDSLERAGKITEAQEIAEKISGRNSIWAFA